MTYISLTCPVCGYTKVYNGHGRCRCGAYLIDHWKGMQQKRGLPIPTGAVYGHLLEGGWKRLDSPKDLP